MSDWGDDDWDNDVPCGGSSRSRYCCYKCDEEGHLARDCPSSLTNLEKPPPRPVPCFKCNQLGHMGRDCPNPDAGPQMSDEWDDDTPFQAPKMSSSSYEGGFRGGMGRWGGGGSRPCYKCNEEGHMARDCPNQDTSGGGGRGGGGMVCYKCNEEGHMARECPNPDASLENLRDSGNRSSGCRKCGEEGHLPRDCPQGGGEEWVHKGRGCYNCGEDGHMSRDCPNPRKDDVDRPPRRPREGCFRCCRCGEEGHLPRDCPSRVNLERPPPAPRLCYNCNEEGHFARECPVRNRRSRDYPNECLSGSQPCYKCNWDGQESHSAGDCPHVNVNHLERRARVLPTLLCSRCNEEGHMAWECPTEAPSGTASRRAPVCFNCKQEGHSPRVCPNVEFNLEEHDDGGAQVNVTATSRSSSCRICNEDGHEAVDCNRPLCYVCSQPGHEGKDCPYEMEDNLDQDWVYEPGLGGTSPGLSSKMKGGEERQVETFLGQRCGKCGDPGHITGNCPNVDPLCN